MKIVKELLIGLLIAVSFLGMFALAALQDSYKYNPPKEAEKTEHPILIKFLVGGE